MAVLFLTFSLIACSASPPVPIDAKGDWLDYSDSRLGYSIKYPGNFRLVPKGSGEIGFRGPDNKVAYRMTVATFDEAKKRGLWVTTEPIGTTYVSGGITSHRYVYDYQIGMKKEHRVAFVVDREGKMLALEFHIASNNTEGTLDQGQTEVLQSFILL